MSSLSMEYLFTPVVGPRYNKWMNLKHIPVMPGVQGVQGGKCNKANPVALRNLGNFHLSYIT